MIWTSGHYLCQKTAYLLNNLGTNYRVLCSIFNQLFIDETNSLFVRVLLRLFFNSGSIDPASAYDLSDI